MRGFLKAGLLLAALVASQVAALAGGLPSVPSTAQFNEPSQIVSTLNAIINQLNGNAAGAGGYAAQPGNIVSLGSFCTNGAGGATPQTCTGMRGLVTFTGVTIAAVTNGALVITDTLLTANNTCRAWIVSDNSAAASFPYVRSAVTTTNTLTVNIGNAAAATSTGASTFGIGFDCNN